MHITDAQIKVVREAYEALDAATPHCMTVRRLLRELVETRRLLREFEAVEE